jgi:hypothetical protein
MLNNARSIIPEDVRNHGDVVDERRAARLWCSLVVYSADIAFASFEARNDCDIHRREERAEECDSGLIVSDASRVIDDIWGNVFCEG